LKLILLAMTGAAAFASISVHADDTPAEWKAPTRAAKRKNPIAANDASIAAGKAVYLKQCLSCHGSCGKGDGPAAKDLPKPPHDLTDPAILAQSDGTLQWKITTGRKPMPAFETLLSEDERWQVVIYTRTLAPTPTK
jgi:mono/diheme cytochrome c family protein